MNFYSIRRFSNKSNLNTLITYSSQRGPVNLYQTNFLFNASRMSLHLIKWNNNLFASLPTLKLLNRTYLCNNGKPILSLNFLFQNLCPETTEDLYRSANHPGFSTLVKSLRHTPLRTATKHSIYRVSKIFKYAVHPTFLQYEHLFDLPKLALFSPFIQASVEHFNVYKPKSNLAVGDPIAWEEGQDFIRRAAFLTLIAGLSKKVRVVTSSNDYLQSLRSSISMRESFNQGQQRPFFLIPRQLTFLNNSEPTSELDGFNFSVKVMLLGHFYDGYSKSFFSRDSFDNNPTRVSVDVKPRLDSLAASFVDRFFLSELFTKLHKRTLAFNMKSLWLFDEFASRIIKTHNRAKHLSEGLHLMDATPTSLSPKKGMVTKFVAQYNSFTRDDFILESLRVKFPIYRLKSGFKTRMSFRFLKFLSRRVLLGTAPRRVESKHIKTQRANIYTNNYSETLNKKFMLAANYFPIRLTPKYSNDNLLYDRSRRHLNQFRIDNEDSTVLDAVSLIQEVLVRLSQIDALSGNLKFHEISEDTFEPTSEIVAELSSGQLLTYKGVHPLITNCLSKEGSYIKGFWRSHISQVLSNRLLGRRLARSKSFRKQLKKLPRKKLPLRKLPFKLNYTRKLFKRLRRRFRRSVKKQFRTSIARLSINNPLTFIENINTEVDKDRPSGDFRSPLHNLYLGINDLETAPNEAERETKRQLRGIRHRILITTKDYIFTRAGVISKRLINKASTTVASIVLKRRCRQLVDVSYKFPQYSPNIFFQSTKFKARRTLVVPNTQLYANTDFNRRLGEDMQLLKTLKLNFVYQTRKGYLHDNLIKILISSFSSYLSDAIVYYDTCTVSADPSLKVVQSVDPNEELKVLLKSQQPFRRFYSRRRTDTSRAGVSQLLQLLNLRSHRHLRRKRHHRESLAVYTWLFFKRHTLKLAPKVRTNLHYLDSGITEGSTLQTSFSTHNLPTSYNYYYNSNFIFFPFQKTLLFSRLWNPLNNLSIGTFFSYVTKPKVSQYSIMKYKYTNWVNFFTNFTNLQIMDPTRGELLEVFKRNSITSRYELPFTLSNVGFLFLSCDTLPWHLEYSLNKDSMKARINTHRLSFFYKNDIKRVYLRRPGLLKLLTSFSEEDSLTEVDSFLNLTWKTSNNNLHSTPNSFGQARLMSAYFNPSVDPHRASDKLELHKEEEYIEKEPMIRRVRFKPGYQRVWRRAREAINYTLNYHYRYQVGLTRRLMRVRRLKRVDALRMQELTLQKTLLNAHFVFDMPSSLLLIQSNTVFVNGVLAYNPNLKLFTGDFIQLIITIRYYIVYRWLVNWNNYHNLRFMKLTNFKNNASRYDLSKQISHHLPDWIFTIGYRALDMPKYLEVDYFTLSAFMIYEPLNISDYNPLNYLDARPEIYSMYNWKFIN